MSNLSKEIQEKISTVKGFGSITRQDIQNLLQLIDQQAKEIEKLKQEYEELEEQASRWREESGN